jgi:hypothetical protein
MDPLSETTVMSVFIMTHLALPLQACILLQQHFTYSIPAASSPGWIPLHTTPLETSGATHVLLASSHNLDS